MTMLISHPLATHGLICPPAQLCWKCFFFMKMIVLALVNNPNQTPIWWPVVGLRKIGRTWRWYNLANTAATISTHCCHFICPGTTYIQICMTIHMISYIVITVNILLNHSFWRTHIYPYHYVLEALKLTFHILPYVQLWHLGKFRGWEPFFGSGVQQVPQIVAPSPIKGAVLTSVSVVHLRLASSI